MNTSYDAFDLKIVVPQDAVPLFERALDPLASALLASLIEKGAQKGNWELQAIFETKPDVVQLDTALMIAADAAGIEKPDYVLNPVPHKNWLRESLLSFKPVEIGSYYIYGSHITTPPPADKIALEIDAATAFGSGEHQTTQGCLMGLMDLNRSFNAVLDMGCGSGILAMAYAKTFHRPVDAVDIDPESVLVTQQNAALNGLADLITVWESVGYEKVSRSDDLIFANILARPLMDMAHDLYAHLNPGGLAILSGFLYRQERWVLKAHEKAGLKFVKRYRVNGWSTLVVQKD